MPEMIIGSPNQNMMVVTNSGAVPVCGYSGTQLFTLRTDGTGALETTANINLGSLSFTAGSESYLYGKSGTSWWPILVESGTGKMITTSTVNVDRVYIASGADIGSVYLKDGGYVGVIPSGIFYSTISASGTGVPISTTYFPGSVSQSTNPWIVLGSTQITNNVLNVSGNVTISNDSFMKVSASGTTGLPISGAVTVTELATAGSLAVQTVIGSMYIIPNQYINIIPSGVVPISGTVGVEFSNDYIGVIQSGTNWSVLGSTQITNSVIQVSGNVSISNGAYVNVIPSGTIYSTIAASGTTGIPVSGVVTVNGTVTVNGIATAGSLATQGIIGSVHINNSVLQISGNTTISNGAYINIIPSGILYTTGCINQSSNPWIVLGSTQITNTMMPISGVVTVTGIGNAGSLAVQGVIGSVHITNSILQISGNTTISDNSYINVKPSGTFYTTGSFNLVNGAYVTGSVNQGTTPWTVLGSTQISNSLLPISGIVNTQLYAGSNVYQGTSPWVVLGSTQISNSVLNISGPVKLTNDSYVNIISSGTTGVPISGTVNVNNIATAGSLSIQKIIGSTYITNTFMPVSGVVNTGLYAGSIIYQGVQPWFVVGSVQISNSELSIDGTVSIVNPSTIGSYATQGITGSVRLSTTYFPGSVNLVNGGYVSIIASGTTGVPISGTVNISRQYSYITGSIPTTAGIGSKTVSMYGEVGLISLVGSNINAGSSYKFGVYDADGYMILSQLTRTGSMSYLTPFPVSGNIILNITDAQSNSNYNFKVAYI